MKKLIVIVAGVLIASGAFAYEPVPFLAEYRALDRVTGAAFRSTALREKAIAVLADVLQGHSDQSLGALASLSALTPQAAAALDLTSVESRSYAAEKIGELGGPDAEIPLLGFLEQPGGTDGRAAIVLRSVHIGLLEIGLQNAGGSRESRIGFARNTLVGPPENPFSHAWAADKLCDMGSAADYALVERSKLSERDDDFSRQQLESCRDKASVLGRNPDTVNAWSSVLLPAGHRESDSVRAWAFTHLLAMHSAAADKVLDRYFSEAFELRDGDYVRYCAQWQLQTAQEYWRAYGRGK